MREGSLQGLLEAETSGGSGEGLLNQLYYIGLPEEFTYRGLLVSHLSLVVGGWPAALASALAFGLFHFPHHGRLKAIETTLSGLIYASLTLISRSVWPSVALHVALNLFVAIEKGLKASRAARP